MRRLALLLGLSVCAFACFNTTKVMVSTTGTGGSKTGTGGAGGAGGTGGSVAPPCLTGETRCGTACIVGSDCDHAVTVVPPADDNVYVNGGSFLELLVSNTEDIVGAHVADADVSFQGAEPGRIWIEIPSGAVGQVDVTIDVAGGAGGGGGGLAAPSSVVTKRAINYRAVPVGTTWTTKTMLAPRGGYPALITTFDDNVLVAGGTTTADVTTATATADIFDDDETDTTSTPAENSMSTKRLAATAITVLDGTTVVAGACTTVAGCPYDSTLIDVFDPTNTAFSPALGKLSTQRGLLRSLRLIDGRILFASSETPPFDVYDPVVDEVTPVVGGAFSTATPATGSIARLRDGTVLVVPGGGGANAIFDPVAGTFTPTGDKLEQYPDALVVLGNGHVLAIGGFTVQSQAGTLVQTTSNVVAELDPATHLFTPWTATLATSRTGSSVVFGRDGLIYVAGGFSGTANLGFSCAGDQDLAQLTFLASVEVLDPSKATVGAGPALPHVGASLLGTALSDGTIVVGAGIACGTQTVAYPSVYFLEAPADPGK